MEILTENRCNLTNFHQTALGDGFIERRKSVDNETYEFHQKKKEKKKRTQVDLGPFYITALNYLIQLFDLVSSISVGFKAVKQIFFNSNFSVVKIFQNFPTFFVYSCSCVSDQYARVEQPRPAVRETEVDEIVFSNEFPFGGAVERTRGGNRISFLPASG